jgi:hypothetical protein
LKIGWKIIENLTGGNLFWIGTIGRRDSETKFGRRVNSLQLYLLDLRRFTGRGFGELFGSSSNLVVRIVDVLLEEDGSPVIFGCDAGNKVSLIEM